MRRDKPHPDVSSLFAVESLLSHTWHIVCAGLTPVLTENYSLIIDLSELRDRVQVFRDRSDAGRVLGNMLESYRNSNAIVLAIPAGGIPVGAAVAEKVGLELDIAVVSKITLPWNTEAGYGAVAFDGTVLLNRELTSALRLTEDEIQEGIARTRKKVERRAQRLRGQRSFPEVSDREVLVVDDGLASGYTMLAAVDAVSKLGSERISVAVPTAGKAAAQRIASNVKSVYCANLRGGGRFAVADAYQEWSDIDESELTAICRRLFAEKRHD